MSGKKIIFLDIDGTLVDYRQKTPESSVQAVLRARANGHQVFLCTGRNKAQIYSDILDLGWDGIISGNGCCIEVGGKIIHRQMIPLQRVVHAVDWLNSSKLGFYAESNDGTYADCRFVEQAAGIYGESNELNRQRIRNVYPQMIYGADLYRDDLSKINFVWNTKLNLESVQREFAGEFLVGVWGLTGPHDEFCELGQPGINKGRAVELLLAHSGADRADTYAFGDAISDREMLKACQTGIAMGNARPELKEVADYITSAVDEDGLLHAFKQFGLI